MERILFIQHDVAEGAVVRAALAGAGTFTVESTVDLTAGVRRLATSDIAAVLFDLGAAVMDGLSALDELIRRAPHVPVVAIAGAADEAAVRIAIERGAQDCLPREKLDSYLLSRALRSAIDRRCAEDALFVERERARVTLDSLGDAVLSTDLSGSVVDLNPTAEALTGWSLREATGRPFADVCRIIDGTTRAAARDPLELSRAGVKSRFTLVQRDGSERAIRQAVAPVRDRHGRVTGAVLVIREQPAVSTATAAEPQLDCLTDLPNRLLLHDRTTQAVAAARRRDAYLAVLFVDLDRFKQVNDSLGHATGDALLRSVARRLAGCVRRSDTVSRHGGDEFVVLLPEIEGPDDAAIVAQKILDGLDVPHAASGRRLRIGASIGISLYPCDGHTPDALLESADIAMYCAKNAGGGGYRFFETGMNIPAESVTTEPDIASLAHVYGPSLKALTLPDRH